jgi:hypothetical protein
MPLSSPFPDAAYNAKIRINGAVHYNMSWTVDAQSNMLPTPNMEGSGYSDDVAGLSSATGTIDGWLDVAANPFDDPLGLQDGVILQNVELYWDAAGSPDPATDPHWSFPVAIVEKANNKADVNDLLKISITFRNKGPFSYPTGNVPNAEDQAVED